MAAKLQEKEMLFCYYFLCTQDPEESVQRAFGQCLAKNEALVMGLSLLRRKGIKGEIARMRRELTPDGETMLYLICRMLLNRQEMATPDGDSLGHFGGLSEVRQKEGAFEAKFFDHAGLFIKLLPAVMPVKEDKKGQDDHFYKAMEAAAQSLFVEDAKGKTAGKAPQQPDKAKKAGAPRRARPKNDAAPRPGEEDAFEIF